MNISERIECLQSLDLFQDLAEGKHQEFIEELEEKRLNPGDILFQDGDLADSLFVLVEGSLEVIKNSRPITRVEPVDYIGEMALLEELPRSATVVAVKPSVLLAVNRPLFERYLHGHPASLLSITRSLSRKIRKDTAMIADDREQANILLHDMRNRLTPFMYLDMLADSLVDSPHARFIAMMQECRRHVTDMTEDAMAIIKKQMRPYLFERTSLQALITDVVENELSVHPDVRDKIIRVNAENVSEFPYHSYDIRRVLINLILNAAQASNPGDTIEIEVAQNGDDAVVRVRDHGGGIPSDIGEKIFAFQFTTKKDGNGLGLPSCKQIVEDRHGGRLSFTSIPNEETVFTFTLPMI